MGRTPEEQARERYLTARDMLCSKSTYCRLPGNPALTGLKTYENVGTFGNAHAMMPHAKQLVPKAPAAVIGFPL